MLKDLDVVYHVWSGSFDDFETAYAEVPEAGVRSIVLTALRGNLDLRLPDDLVRAPLPGSPSLRLWRPAHASATSRPRPPRQLGPVAPHPRGVELSRCLRVLLRTLETDAGPGLAVQAQGKRPNCTRRALEDGE